VMLISSGVGVGLGLTKMLLLTSLVLRPARQKTLSHLGDVAVSREALRGL